MKERMIGIGLAVAASLALSAGCGGRDISSTGALAAVSGDEPKKEGGGTANGDPGQPNKEGDGTPTGDPGEPNKGEPHKGDGTCNGDPGTAEPAPTCESLGLACAAIDFTDKSVACSASLVARWDLLCADPNQACCGPELPVVEPPDENKPDPGTGG